MHAAWAPAATSSHLRRVRLTRAFALAFVRRHRTQRLDTFALSKSVKIDTLNSNPCSYVCVWPMKDGAAAIANQLRLGAILSWA